jgi:hypothetical protein
LNRYPLEWAELEHMGIARGNRLRMCGGPWKTKGTHPTLFGTSVAMAELSRINLTERYCWKRERMRGRGNGFVTAPDVGGLVLLRAA